MPLRKKHVRRIVTVLLVAGVLGPAAALALYGLHLRGGACGRALEEVLETRLRCDAAARRARPTGPSTAAADEVRLTWTTADGHLTLRLEDLKAQSDAYGWYVTAARGHLSLAGPDPHATLAALNQRLVQVQHPSQLMSVTVERLHLALDLDPLTIETDVRALALPKMTTLAVSLFDPGALEGEPRSALDETIPRPLAAVRLNPTSDKGVFDGLHVEMKDLPLAALRKAIRRNRQEGIGGTADLAVDWHWPETDPDTAAVKVTARGLDLSQWTQDVPGGPVTGTADLEVRYAKRRQRAPALAVHLESGGGALAGETLEWLEGLPAGLKGPGAARPKTAPFDRMDVRFHAVGDRGWYVGEKDTWDTIPILTVRLLGLDVPLLRASGWPFDASGLWAPLREGLGLGPSHAAEKK